MKLIGCFIYLTHTRIDLSYAVSMASIYMDQPHEIHWSAAKMILNFVQGTRTHGIFYKAKSDLDLIGFTNCDWKGDNIDQKSTLGYVFMLAEGPINQLIKQEPECHCTLIYISRVQRSCKCNKSMFMVARVTW